MNTFPDFSLFYDSNTPNIQIASSGIENNQIHINPYNMNQQPYVPMPIDLFSMGSMLVSDSEINADKIINKNETGEIISMADTNNPYIASYVPVMNELNELNIEIKNASNDTLNDIKILRSQNGKAKYNNLANMMSNYSSLVAARLNVIKEVNSIINNSHNLDLKRFNQNARIAAAEDKNDDGIIMNLYGMVSENINRSNMQQQFNQALANNNNYVTRPEDQIAIDKIYDDYMSEYEKLNAEVVVLYNEANGVAEFKTVDSIGNFIEGTNMPSDMYLSNLLIDKNNMIARDKNLNISYRLILTNNLSTDDDF